MTVNPGFGGQSFIPSMLGKISNLNDIMSNYEDEIELQVDGGVKPDNAGDIKESGATILVAGSAIFNSKDYTKAIQTLRDA
jgi:ribulose-phosphate 3-epimerase